MLIKVLYYRGKVSMVRAYAVTWSVALGLAAVTHPGFSCAGFS